MNYTAILHKNYNGALEAFRLRIGIKYVCCIHYLPSGNYYLKPAAVLLFACILLLNF